MSGVNAAVGGMDVDNSQAAGAAGGVLPAGAEQQHVPQPMGAPPGMQLPHRPFND